MTSSVTARFQPTPASAREILFDRPSKHLDAILVFQCQNGHESADTVRNMETRFGVHASIEELINAFFCPKCSRKPWSASLARSSAGDDPSASRDDVLLLMDGEDL